MIRFDSAHALVHTVSTFRFQTTGADAGAAAQQASGDPTPSRVRRPPRTGTDTPGNQLDQQDRAKLEQLRARDRVVRAHEQAHRTAAGDLAQGATRYDYQTGSDGVRYAVGGEVQIDTSDVAGDARATIAKAERIISAALAPSQPSAQDRAVAAKAAAMAAEARVELARQSAGVTGDEGEAGAGSSRPEAILLDLAV